jgi:hypothetical protein
MNVDKRQMGKASSEINQILQNIKDGLLNDPKERIATFITEAVAPGK